jgi:uncharacterized UPF0160 family protein
MPLRIATHDGSFHADDVTAYALIRAYLDADATVTRTRDDARLAQADIVIDVGGVFDAAQGRFDHHQVTYQGPLSSAGMVLDHLEAKGHVRAALAARLRETLVDYVDAVDNGRTKPEHGRPCITSMVGMIGEQATTFASFDPLYVRASDMVLEVIRGIEAGLVKEERATEIVHAAMDEAVAAKRNVILLEGHESWKKPYFARGGAEHETEFVLFPGERDVRVSAIPPELGSFGQKRSFPEAWAGLTDEALSLVTGVPGSIFCHKNRFIAVFANREAAEQALLRGGLWHRSS